MIQNRYLHIITEEDTKNQHAGTHMGRIIYTYMCEYSHAFAANHASFNSKMIKEKTENLLKVGHNI